MRITGGSYKGHNIQYPKGVLRPAMDRMRESLFSILGGLHGRSFLDVFCGSGIIGIEAASRGAEPVFFVERDRKKTPAIKKNLSIVKEKTRLLIMPAERFLKFYREQFNIIFLDPPFAYRYKGQLLRIIEERRILKAGGILCMHLPKQEPAPDSVGDLFCDRRKYYGGSGLLFYRWKEEQ